MTDEKIQHLLNALTPDQQAFARAATEMKIQNKVYEKQLVDLKDAYDNLWKVMIVILHAQPGNELRVHETQFLRFEGEYRVDRTFDKYTKEVVLRLLTVHDEPTIPNESA